MTAAIKERPQRSAVIKNRMTRMMLGLMALDDLLLSGALVVRAYLSGKPILKDYCLQLVLP